MVQLRYPLPEQAFVAFPAHEVVACAAGHASDVVGEVLDDGGGAEGGHDDEDADCERGREKELGLFRIVIVGRSGEGIEDFQGYLHSVRR